MGAAHGGAARWAHAYARMLAQGERRPGRQRDAATVWTGSWPRRAYGIARGDAVFLLLRHSYPAPAAGSPAFACAARVRGGGRRVGRCAMRACRLGVLIQQFV